MAEASQSRSDPTVERDGASDDAVTDATLLQGVTERAPRALDAFYDRFARRAYALARRICGAARLPHEVVASGAGHDAAIFAGAGVPAAMVFVRNEGGSHNPREAMDFDDFTHGAALLREVLLHGAEAVAR